MKLRKVKWQNHPVLGNLEIDFLRSDGTPYDNIILVGENGAGKTSVLTTISTFLNIGDFDCFEYFEFETDGITYRALHREEGQGNSTFFRLQDCSTGAISRINRDRHNSIQNIFNNTQDPRSYGCVLSKARADYQTDKITQTTTKSLDAEAHSIDSEDKFTSLKQLFVDVKSQDDHLFRALNKNRSQSEMITEKEFEQRQSKLYRFVKAFDEFFSDAHLYFHDVEDNNDHKEILFKKFDKDVPIDNLSTGEKQIVFRGIYLLRNLAKLNGGTIFVDEPEISMHPLWQKKILAYYQGLFTNVQHQQVAQMFFASHSNYVLESALAKHDENLVIVLLNQGGTIQARKVESTERALPHISSAEVNYLVFNLPSRDYHNELYGYLQIKEGVANTGTPYNVKECDDFIKRNAQYDATRHYKRYNYTDRNGHAHYYETLPSYIRNCIDHPNPPTHPEPNDDEVKISIDLLRALCR